MQPVGTEHVRSRTHALFGIALADKDDQGLQGIWYQGANCLQWRYMALSCSVMSVLHHRDRCIHQDTMHMQCRCALFLQVHNAISCLDRFLISWTSKTDVQTSIHTLINFLSNVLLCHSFILIPCACGGVSWGICQHFAMDLAAWRQQESSSSCSNARAAAPEGSRETT